MNPYLQKRCKLTDAENRLVDAKWEAGWSVMDWQLGVSRCRLLHLQQISNEVLLYNTGNHIQSLGIEHYGRLYDKRSVYMCMLGSLCCTQKLTQHVNQLQFNLKNKLRKDSTSEASSLFFLFIVYFYPYSHTVFSSTSFRFLL